MKNVNLEVAKLAKEKGFNEKCFHYYIVDFNADGIQIQHPTPIMDNPNILQLSKASEKQLHIISAPYQSQLQTWLRDNHMIDIIGKLFNVKGKKMYAFDICKNSIYIKCEKKDTYEEALDISLLEALNLIKNDDLVI